MNPDRLMQAFKMFDKVISRRKPTVGLERED